MCFWSLLRNLLWWRKIRRNCWKINATHFSSRKTTCKKECCTENLSLGTLTNECLNASSMWTKKFCWLKFCVGSVSIVPLQATFVASFHPVEYIFRWNSVIEWNWEREKEKESSGLLFLPLYKTCKQLYTVSNTLELELRAWNAWWKCEREASNTHRRIEKRSDYFIYTR